MRSAPRLRLFYIFLAVHLGITLINDQLDAQRLVYNTFISILYMFRATPCSSSGGQIIRIKTASGIITLRKCRSSMQVEKELLELHTGRTLMESDHTRCCINTILPPDDEHGFARNM